MREKTAKTLSEVSIKEDKNMLEARITIEAPELTAAINNLAAAIGGKNVQTFAPNVSVTQTQPPASAQPPVTAPPVNTQPPAMNPPAAPQPPVNQTPASAQNYAAPGVPLAQPPQYTVDQIMAAGAMLMDAGKANELINLLHSFGVQAVMDLKQEQLGAFATAMREMGAKI